MHVLPILLPMAAASAQFIARAPSQISLHPLLCASPTNNTYNDLVANHSATFHMNYNKANVTPNGPLSSLSIDWADNNVNLLGRSNFVKRLQLFWPIAPGLQIHDRIHVNDGNMAAILYNFQGNATGSFNGAPPTNAKVQAQGGEMMIYDENALLTRLITIEETDLLEMQIIGGLLVPKFDVFPPTAYAAPNASPEHVCSIKVTASSFSNLFNANQTDKITSLLSPSVTLHADNTTFTGPTAVTNHWHSFRTSFPDLLMHDEYILGQGNYTAVETIAEGTFTGKPFVATNGTVVKPTGAMSRVRILRFFQHDADGLVINIWEVHNNGDFLTQTVDTGAVQMGM
jgi:hypothetical protein